MESDARPRRLYAQRREDVGGFSMILLATAVATAQQGAVGGQWRWHSGDLGSTKYAPLDQINKQNVGRLQIAWRRPAVDISIVNKKPDFSFSRDFRATPLMIDGTLYGPNGIGLVEAFHPATGKTLWVQQPFADEPQQGLAGDSTRTVSYWAEGNQRRLFRHPRRVSDRARPAHRAADHDVGRERPGEPEARPRTESDHLRGVKRTTSVR